ncbi:MAG: hypothetical protein KDK56_08870 [Simkania sp.]|nr:hypothetical protein [Simkania sp.]MCP5489579.1 hypothetical protein [Chlamydiales bacterium]
MSAPGPCYYSTQEGWEEQQNAQWTQMMQKMDSITTASGQLEYFFLVMAQFLIENSNGEQAWSGYDMNASSGIETNLSDLMHQVNVCENGQGSIQNVQMAQTDMNNILLEECTDPAVANKQMQTQTLDAFQDLCGDQPNIVTTYSVPVYYDGSTEPTYVDVPQINMNATQQQNVLNDWDGNAYIVNPAGQPTATSMTPSNQGYQAYLAAQSQWTSDLTTVDDSCGEVDQMAQAEYSQDESNEKTELGTLEDAFNNFVKNQSYWNQQTGNS